jgi:quercetin 2,3-dioxygenase
MSVTIYPFEKQHKGGFNGGEIVENKPVQLSDDGKLQPYSSLFYWANAIAKTDSTIGLHPHQAFEIMSFVLEGEIEHYDTKNQKWIPLKAGDVQIIRAGSGISHAERLHKNGRIFQIWLDPDLKKTFRVPATYNDYAADLFPATPENGFSVKTFKGEGAPLSMETPGITIREIGMKKGAHRLPVNDSEVLSIYVLNGVVNVGNQTAKQDDFIVVNDENEFRFSSEDAATLFVITSPAKVNYETYVSRYAEV